MMQRGKNCAYKSQGNGETNFGRWLDFQITEGFASTICTPNKTGTGYNTVSWDRFNKSCGEFNSETGRTEIE